MTYFLKSFQFSEESKMSMQQVIIKIKVQLFAVIEVCVGYRTGDMVGDQGKLQRREVQQGFD